MIKQTRQKKSIIADKIDGTKVGSVRVTPKYRGCPDNLLLFFLPPSCATLGWKPKRSILP